MKKIVLAVVMVMALNGCVNKEQKTPEPVKVKSMTVGDNYGTLSQGYSGTIEEMSATALSFAMGGTIKQLLVEDGQMVRQGQVLATIDATTASNGLESARATTSQAGDIVQQGGPYTEARKRQVIDLALTEDDCYTLEFSDAGSNGITGQNGRGYYMLHEVGADGKTRLLTQADYTTALHEVYFSLQNAGSTNAVAMPAAVWNATDDSHPAYTPDGRRATSRSHLIIYKGNKIITTNK